LFNLVHAIIVIYLGYVLIVYPFFLCWNIILDYSYPPPGASLSFLDESKTA